MMACNFLYFLLNLQLVLCDELCNNEYEFDCKLNERKKEPKNAEF